MMESISANIKTLNEEHQERWDIMFEKLKDYKHRVGDTNVPSSNKGREYELGRWTCRQRELYREGHISQERKAKLNSIAFQWESLLDRAWQTRYNKLVEFVGANGHCRVPSDYECDPSLANWVKGQCWLNNEGLLSTPRKAMLHRLGFMWDSRSAESYVSTGEASDPPEANTIIPFVTETQPIQDKMTESNTPKESEEGREEEDVSTQPENEKKYDMNYFLAHIYKPLEDEAGFDLSFSDDIPSLRHCKYHVRKRNNTKRPFSSTEMAVSTLEKNENSQLACRPGEKCHHSEEDTKDEGGDEDDEYMYI